jgi:XrtN system VIT domain protein
MQTHPTTHPGKDQAIILGLVLIGLSAAVFLVPELASSVDSGSHFGFFFFNYIFTGLYLLYLLVRGLISLKWKSCRVKNSYVLLLLVLAMISAFSLNRVIPVFQHLVPWVTVFLVVQCVVLILFCFFELMPLAVRYAMSFLLGAGSVVYLYFTFVLVPLYSVGLLGAVVFVISLHVYVPLLFFICSVVIFLAVGRSRRSLGYTFLAGSLLCMLITTLFVLQWSSTKNIMNREYSRTLIVNNDDLPNWAGMSQYLPDTWITERMLKTGLVYSVPNLEGNPFWSIPTRNFGEVKKHDPLVMTAAFIYGLPLLSDEEKVKVLESLYDSRHHAQERLWSGDNLETSSVITNVRIWPSYRMAYTEKTLTVSNASSGKTRQQEHEGVYTFHLPEGSAVTSLSLWINGREEKARLTTKEKADSAYRTIVGVEVRDPSVVHWQEGNTVLVRVFPVTPAEPRIFRIGVTSPLSLQGNRLVYENIYFDGPDGSGAREERILDFVQEPAGLDLPFSADSEGSKRMYSGDYRPDWQLSFDAPGLENTAFSFGGKSYSVQPLEKKYDSFPVSSVYLDINQAWTDKQVQEIWEMVKDRQVYVFDNVMIRVTAANAERIFERLRKRRFSLFPLYELEDPQHSLLISASTGVSPNLSELKTSEFHSKLKHFLAKGFRVRLFSISTELSPYLKTLRELRVLECAGGEPALLATLLSEQVFPAFQENDSTVVIASSGMKITGRAGVKQGSAPDHFLRLFAYNDILRKANRNLLLKGAEDSSMVEEARMANVVSPVSSLIVLETRQDYERFDIQESQNGLKNASMKSSGAVPEPHEWMLIALMLMVVIYVRYRA